jgi:hypothetical protein
MLSNRDQLPTRAGLAFLPRAGGPTRVVGESGRHLFDFRMRRLHFDAEFKTA